MNTGPTRPSAARRFRSALVVGAALVAVCVLPGAASAHDRHRDRGHRHRVVERHHVQHHRVGHRHLRRHHLARHRVPRHRISAHFVVPSRIRVRSDAVYRPYYHGRVYHRGHGHFHAVYRFPVHTGFEVIHRPYAYCGDRLFSGHVAFHGRDFAIHIGF